MIASEADNLDHLNLGFGMSNRESFLPPVPGQLIRRRKNPNMTNLAHFVVTRFNLRAAAATSDYQIDEEWLSRRLDLFERFCFPTVAGQSVQDFRWLVLFDSETPPKIRDRIAKLREWQNFTPKFVPPATEHSCRLAVTEQLDTVPDLLVTTRLDNDDGICRTFVEQIRRRLENVNVPTVLEFPVGYVLHKNRLYIDRQTHNPFTTLAEPCRGSREYRIRTVYSGSHTDVAKLGQIVNVTGEPAWIQVIHGGNLENRARGVRCPIADIARDFDIRVESLSMREQPLEYYLDKAVSLLRTSAYIALGKR